MFLQNEAFVDRRRLIPRSPLSATQPIVATTDLDRAPTITLPYRQQGTDCPLKRQISKAIGVPGRGTRIQDVETADCELSGANEESSFLLAEEAEDG